jgi:osmoprotectant transport system substrate-binding protein
MNWKRIGTFAVIGILLMTFVTGCPGGGAKEGRVTVGSKDFTESILLGEIVAQMVEANSQITVERKLNLGGTKVNFDGIRRGNLDMYAEYDGTGYGVHLGHEEPITDPATVYPQVKREFEEKFQLTWSNPFGFNNTYALAIPQQLAEQYNIRTYTDLVPHSDKFTFGTTNEFMGRPADGYNALVEEYGFTFKGVSTMTAGLRYPAMAQNEIQVMDAYATDGKLQEFNLVILEDDRAFFPPYNGAVVVRTDTVERNPGLMDVLNRLGGTMSDEIMQQLNYRVEVKGETVETVAADFLRSAGLVAHNPKGMARGR